MQKRSDMRSGRIVSFALVLLALSVLGCSRIAQVPPQEVQKLSGPPSNTVRVELEDGAHAFIRPGFSNVRIVPRKDTGFRDRVIRPPFAATVDRDALVIWDSPGSAPRVYPLGNIERAEVTQHDGSRAEPLWAGLLIGTVTGAVIGAVTSKECAPDTGSSHEMGTICLGRAGGTILGGFLGAGIGAVVSIPFMADLKYYDKDDE